MKKQEAVNTFSEGLTSDLNPLSMPNNVLSNCLNGTLLTYNGNEYMLQNDMGNCRVETAMLPTGYIPLGSTSFGGIIYIVSYNPIEKKYQIGSFPSPERNLSKDELGDTSNVNIDLNKFCENNWEYEYLKDSEGNIIKDTEGNSTVVGFGDISKNIITNYYQKIQLLDFPLYPGDKYKISSPSLKDICQYLSAYDKSNNKLEVNKYPKYLKLDIIATLDDGKTIILTDDSVWTKELEDKAYYYIDFNGVKDIGKNTLAEYRGIVGSNYDTYVSKLSGKLGIAARLEVPTSFSVGYEIISKQEVETNVPVEIYNLYFYFNWTNENNGEDKNRVNPYSIKCSVNNYTDFPDIKIKLASTDQENNPDQSDATENKDYLTIIPPNNYYKSQKDLIDYLQNGKNQFDTKKYRQNDGTDFQYLAVGPVIKKSSDDFHIKTFDQEDKVKWVQLQPQSQEGLLRFTLTPCMKFGQLKFLEKTLNVDLSVERGNLKLRNYQYYIDDNSINIDFTLEGLLNLGEIISRAKLYLYPLQNHIADISGVIPQYLDQNTYSDEDNNIDRNILNLPKYLDIETPSIAESEGIVVCNIPNPLNGANRISYKKSELKALQKDTIYFAEFRVFIKPINSSERELHFYRLFFNSTIFNNAYNTVEDFKELYLYEPNKDYGITPTFKFNNGISSNIDYSQITNFEEYRTQKDTEVYNKQYNITHDINSSFSIQTGLNELSISVNNNEDTQSKKVEYSVQADYKEGLKVRDYAEINNGPYVTSDNIFQMTNNFNITIPYTVEYSNMQQLDEYVLENLVDGARTHRVMLQHASVNEKYGTFNFYVNQSDNRNTEANIVDSFYIPDESKSLSHNLDSITLYLQNIMNTYKYDYMTILFGIPQMEDKDRAYGISELNSGSSRFYKLRSDQWDFFIDMTCIRNEDSVIIVHKRNIYLLNDTIKTGDENYPFYRKFDDIIKAGHTTRGSIIETDFKGNAVSPKEYKKYKNIKNTKPLYFINGNNLIYEENPTIDIQYNFTINPKSFILVLGNQSLSFDDITNPVHNLSIKDLNKLDVQITAPVHINNQDYVQNQLSITSMSKVWDNTENKVIPYERTSKVYEIQNGNIKVNNNLIVENDIVRLSDISLAPTKWYFGWEHTGGTGGTQINRNEFLESHQYYTVENTYGISGFQVSEIEDDPELEYKITEEQDNTNSTTTLNIERVGTPKDFSDSTITVGCTGGVSNISEFQDNAEEQFNTTVEITPDTNSICQISLKYGDNEVGSFTISNTDPSEI